MANHDLNSQKQRNRGDFLNLIKIISKKSTAIIFNGENLNALFLKLGTMQECPPSLLLFNIVL